MNKPSNPKIDVNDVNVGRVSDSVTRQEADSVVSGAMSGYAALTRPTRLKYVATINDESISDATESDYELQYIDIGNVDSYGAVHNVVAYKFEDAPSRARRVARHGDVIISTVRTYLQAIAPIENPPENLIVSTGFAVVRPNRNLFDAHFCKYAVREKHFLWEVESRSSGVSYPAINASDLADIRISLPSLETQRLIADYLDRETAHIDTLVAEKEKMLALLEEKRAALISRAVTRGLNPDAPLKPSGLDWLGDIPAHWETRPIKFCVVPKKDAVKTGPFGSQLVASEMDQGTIKVYNQKNVIQKDLYSGDNYITNHKFEELKAFSVFPGDILITTRGTIGRCAIVPNDAEVGILHPCLMRIQVNSGIVLPEYLALLIQDGHIVLLQLRILSNATTIEVIYSESLNSVIIPVPPIDEQNNILEEISAGNSVVNKAITEVRTSINLLKERRAALITAAVTGQIPIEAMRP